MKIIWLWLCALTLCVSCSGCHHSRPPPVVYTPLKSAPLPPQNTTPLPPPTDEKVELKVVQLNPRDGALCLSMLHLLPAIQAKHHTAMIVVDAIWIRDWTITTPAGPVRIRNTVFLMPVDGLGYRTSQSPGEYRDVWLAKDNSVAYISICHEGALL